MERKGRRGKLKWFIMVLALCSVVGGVAASTYTQRELQAASAFTTPTFNLYETVRLGNSTFTVVGQGSEIKLLSTTASAANQTWANAQASLSGYSNTFGTLGNTFVAGRVKQPLYNDLSAVISGNALNASVPKFSADWWLGDTNASTNRSRFADVNNMLNKSVDFLYEINNNGTCGSENRPENGVKATTAQKQADFQIKKPDTGKVSIDLSSSHPSSDVILWTYMGANCTGTKYQSGGLYLGQWEAVFTNGQLTSTQPNGGVIYKALFELGEIGVTPGEKYSNNLSFNTCVNFLVPYDKGYGKYIYSFMYTSKSGSAGFPYTVTVTDNSELNTTAQTCIGKTHTAGTSSVRPMLTLPTSSIAFANTNKRTYTAGSHISSAFPVHDGGANKSFLTLLSSGLTVGLTTGQPGVSGNTYTTDMPGDGILNLPVTIAGASEGTRYVSASATINGVKKYGVLKEMTGNSAVVQIDLNDFTSDLSTLNSIGITLYQENAGSYQTAYIGNGTDVTVNLIHTSPQEIAFDADQNNTVAYGDTLTLQASLTTSTSEQSTADLLFSIKSGDAIIKTQNYNFTTGKATATIVPANGTGSFVVAINKAADENASAASEQTYTVILSKKQITIRPVKPSKIYAIGEAMPSLLSTSDGLVGSDTIDTAVKPDLINTDGSATLPDTSGMITSAGTWKLIYPANIQSLLSSSFGAKYDVTFEDWNTDETLMFETAIANIPDGWIIVAPDANEHGWNKEAVTISPSTQAQQAGYDTIDVLNSDGSVGKTGKTITYDTEVQSVTPTIRLKKGNTGSDPLTLRNIKIDKTAPDAGIVIDKENDWASMKKKVTITPTDNMSGINTIQVVRDGSTPYTPVENAGSYSFDADTNGDYAITITDKAGNTKTITKSIQKIDTSVVSINAEKLAQTTPEAQDIRITFDGGRAGVQSLKVYYQRDGSTYQYLKDVDATTSPLTFTAEMNGTYKFVLTTNALVEKSVEITIEGLTPPLPDTLIEAVYVDDPTTPYAGNTWTNLNILLTLRNVNTELTGADITWEMSTDGTNWESMNGDTTKEITTDTYHVQSYQFRATAVKGDNTFHETLAETITVKIDKIKPSQPVVQDRDQYTKEIWYAEDETLETTFTAKTNGISEEVYVCEGTKFTCENTPASWKKTQANTYTVMGNGNHEVYFKVMDEAGNTSEMSDAVYVNINNTTPVITIKLNNNPIKEFLNGLTFGFFFKDTVNVEVEVDYGPAGSQSGYGTKGDTYIVIDESSGTMPEENADWGNARSSTSIDPNTKAMIYVKAVSDAGIVARESSIYDVYADNVAPSITVTDQTTWTRDTMLSFEVEDTLSGLDPDALTYQLPNATVEKFSVTNGKGTISNLPDGTYNISLQVADRSSNQTSAQVQVMIDKTAPVIEDPTAVPSGWADQKTVTFKVDDVTSGIASVHVTDKDGIEVHVVDHEDGTYSFDVKANGLYTCTVIDEAGNVSEVTYEEASIDNIAPTITDKIVDKASEYTSSKQVSFVVQDENSGVASVVVTYEVDGETKTASLRGPDASGKYSFTANVNGIYTITAKDVAGNTSEDTIEIENIDPNGIKIINISNTQTWAKDHMTVTFEVQAGLSTLASGFPTVKKDGGAITVTKDGSVYQFQADANGTYVVEAENTGGDKAEETIEIQKIDFLPPQIYDISANTTDTEWREPQTISFHVNDYNDREKTNTGSGLKDGYPKVYYMEDDNRIDVTSKQDTNDSTLFHFLADKNVTYIVEVVDLVEHELVDYEIPVDHILDASWLSQIDVVATNHDQTIGSGTWVQDEVVFTISGGLDASILEGYEFAVTDGTAPTEADWQAINTPDTNQHVVTGEQKDSVYWFRAVPFLHDLALSDPFIVNIDDTPPTQPVIQRTNKPTSLFAQFMDMVTFGNWIKDAQVITFEAEDNFTAKENLVYVYAEENDGVVGAWKEYTGTLEYEETDIILHVKAVDQAGNPSTEAVEPIQIDSEPPLISGAKDESIYKQYYIPRFVTVSDSASGLASAVYTKDDGAEIPLQDSVVEKIKGEGIYKVTAMDHAGNEVTITFKIVSFPDIETEIDGSDENKAIIDQIQEELDETRNNLTSTEVSDYEKWIDDATDKWTNSRNKVVETDDKTAKVEGQDDTTFDPTTELIVEPIDEEEMPELPRKAMYNYDVYLMKGNTPVQPDGSMKVYLPYNEEADPIVYQVNDQNEVSQIPVQREGNYVTFVTNRLVRYAISSTSQAENGGGNSEDSKDVCVVGPDGVLGNAGNPADDVCGKGNGTDEPIKKPDGSVEVPNGGSVVFPDGSEVELPDGGIIKPDGSVVLPDGTEYDPDGNEVPGGNEKPDPDPNPDDGVNPKPDDGKDKVCVVGPDGELGTKDDVCGSGSNTDKPVKKPDGSVEVPNGGSVVFPDGSEVELPDGGIIKPDGSVVLPDGTEYDPDGNEVPGGNEKPNPDPEQPDPKPEDPEKPDPKPDDGKEPNPDGGTDSKPDDEKPNKECTLEEKNELNVDTDGDGIPDINLDIDHDCKPELNISVGNNKGADIDIDTDGDGKPDVNLDINKDGKPDVNIVLNLKWKPNVTYTVNGFTYNSMKGLVPDVNVDDDGDGEPDRNVDTSGDGIPDTNVDADWWSKHDMKKPTSTTSVQGNYSKNIGGALTGENTKWILWLLSLLITAITMAYTFIKKRKKES